MNLQLTGHHLEITPAMREYVQSKLIRIHDQSDYGFLLVCFAHIHALQA